MNWRSFAVHAIWALAAVLTVYVLVAQITSCHERALDCRSACIESGKPPLECKVACDATN